MYRYTKIRDLRSKSKISLSRATDGVRTRDPNLGKVVLYQLSHCRIFSCSDGNNCFYKSDRRGSNPRPQPWQGCTLPTEPLSHIELFRIRTIIILLRHLRFVNNFFKELLQYAACLHSRLQFGQSESFHHRMLRSLPD